MRPGEEKTSQYYYLPTNLHLSRRADGVPEFLFLKFTTEARAENGGINGGLMHFLMEWGLTLDQENELKQKLKKVDPKAELMGACRWRPRASRQLPDHLGDAVRQQDDDRHGQSGKAPLVPGGKAAAAARLSAEGAQLLAATFEKQRSISDARSGSTSSTRC